MATAPSISERPANEFEPRTIAFPDVIKRKINEWVYANIESLSKRMERVFKNEIPELRRIVDGEPREKNKSWPFPNCSNVVAQLAGEAVDELVAWVLQLVWITQPLVSFRYPEEKDEEKAKKNADKKKALETFIDNAAFDPNDLNLYPYHNAWFTEAAAIGKARICVAPEERIEAVWSGYQPRGGSKGLGANEFENKTIRKGPKLINLRYEDILVNPDVDVFEENDPIFRRCTLNVRKIRERVFKGHFLKDEAKKVLDSQPDQYGGDQIKKRENQKEGISDSQDNMMGEWIIWEGYFSWFHNGKKFRLISWYHQKTKTMLNCVYNFIPENQIPIVETRLSVKGIGLAKMLKYYQEEVSTEKNQRRDAITWGTLGINTIDPQNRNVDKNLVIVPGMCIPAKKGTFEHNEVANPAFAGLSLENEQALIQQSKMRAGVDPPISGAGAGSANKKGQFGSMGTLAVLQAGNSRSAHRTSGFRHSSVRLFSLITDFFGFMGLGDSELAKEALQDYLKREMQIPVRAADASMNKEVTKQNEIILNQAYAAYIKQTSSLLQAYQNPTAGDPQYKKWLRGIIIGNTRMFQQVLKDFQLTDNPQEFAPDIDLPMPQEPEQQNAQTPQPQPGLNKVAEFIQGRGGGGSPPTGASVPGAMPGLAGKS